MNAKFNSALKQSTSVRKDLEAFAAAPTSAPPSLQGQISASLTSLSRTLDDYEQLSKQELDVARAQKAHERIQNFRGELHDFREQFNRLKRDREVTTHSELSGRRPHQTATPENPYANSTAAPLRPWAPMTTGSADYERETHAFREQNFLASTNATLDEYLARGQAVLGDLGQQREMLKKTQKRLYSAANTLGISGDTIRMVERRAKEDKWIFGAGVVVFLVFCWLVLKFLR